MCSEHRIAIQDTYGQRFQHCWGCGPQNQDGLHLKSFPNADGSECLCHFTPERQYTGGVPTNLYGGLISMIFDCHGTASAAWFNHHNNGLTLDENTVITRYITGRLEIDFISPVPMEKEITVRARAEEIGDRKITVTMIMEVGGKIHAKAKMIAVRVKDHM